MTILAPCVYEPTAFDFALGAVMQITVIVLAFLLHVFLIRYVYQDAHERGDPKKILWTLLVLFSSLFGVGIYFFVTRDLAPRIRIASALWVIHAFILLLLGVLIYFSGSLTARTYGGGYGAGFIVYYMLFLPSLLIGGSGVCALRSGFQVRHMFIDSEIRTNLILAALGLILFLSAILSIVISFSRSFPVFKQFELIGPLLYFGMLFIIIFYALSIRGKARSR
ncbi:MAG: PLDc N-terminal domain-containing protein [Candidatus Hodarchaeota archaeon]